MFFVFSKASPLLETVVQYHFPNILQSVSVLFHQQRLCWESHMNIFFCKGFFYGEIYILSNIEIFIVIPRLYIKHKFIIKAKSSKFIKVRSSIFSEFFFLNNLFENFRNFFHLLCWRSVFNSKDNINTPLFHLLVILNPTFC